MIKMFKVEQAGTGHVYVKPVELTDCEYQAQYEACNTFQVVEARIECLGQYGWDHD